MHVTKFENELAHAFGVREAIAVASGTAAIHCALAAVGVGKDDEVLVPSLSVIMSVVPVLYQNAKPIFVDCESGRIDFDYRDLERKVSPRTKVILPVYLWGYPYDMPRLIDFARKHRLTVIEDACQAHGSKWNGKYLGTWGSLGCFSMKDGKLLATGEGGFILTNNSLLARRCKALRNHCANLVTPRLSYSQLGWNYRLSESQASLGRKQLACFDKNLKRRKWQAHYIFRRLADISGLEQYKVDAGGDPNYLSPVLIWHGNSTGRKVAGDLSRRGVMNSVGTYDLRPTHERRVFLNAVVSSSRRKGLRLDVAPNASQFLDHVLALILERRYSKARLDKIIDTVRSVLNTKTRG